MSIQRRGVLAALAGAPVAGCTGLRPGSGLGARGADDRLTLATTSSVDDTGLLEHLNARFEETHDVGVKTVAQGTGAALATGRAGDADLVLVHAKAREEEFVRQGYGLERHPVMENDFVFVGPAEDPAGLAEAETVEDALEALGGSEVTFISRGDESGTHIRERQLWEMVGIDVTRGEWYLEAGAGMGIVLVQSSERGAYTLTDTGTFGSMVPRLDLDVLFGGPAAGIPKALRNPYGIIAVNPSVHEHAAFELATTYIDFVTGPDGQELIDTYRVNDRQLFRPIADQEEG